MRWNLEEFSYAGHEIKIRFNRYDNKLKAHIKGPRSGMHSKDRFANDVEWEINSRIPFMSPPVNKVDSKIYPIYKEARDRIDTAIAAHAKKHEDEYK